MRAADAPEGAAPDNQAAELEVRVGHSLKLEGAIFVAGRGDTVAPRSTPSPRQPEKPSRERVHPANGQLLTHTRGRRATNFNFASTG